ncbi:MAG: hypothetical protein M3N57_00560, partial [Actinomycetota bacterium]|nr:hypothetical protein [Actinomycetota bacterium]
MTAPVTVVGVGPGGLAGGGDEALAGATLVVGGARHLARWAPPGIATVELTGDLQPGLAAVAAAAGPVVVVASGDPG